jgi:hypothetical protein
MTNLRITKDIYPDVTIVTKSFVLPGIRSSNPPPNLIYGRGGGLSYDIETKRVYYNNGSAWLPLATANGAGSTVNSYSHIKNIVQNIQPNIDTTISGWTATPFPPHHTLAQWDLVTGVYTATEFQHLGVDADVSWMGGISNLGQRILRIRYYDFNSNTTITSTEVITQADPNTSVETTQEISDYLRLNPGDQVWVEVRHDAPVNLSISSGEHTSICGVRIMN